MYMTSWYRYILTHIWLRLLEIDTPCNYETPYLIMDVELCIGDKEPSHNVDVSGLSRAEAGGTQVNSILPEQSNHSSLPTKNGQILKLKFNYFAFLAGIIEI
jgi:hypothetical protein